MKLSSNDFLGNLRIQLLRFLSTFNFRWALNVPAVCVVKFVKTLLNQLETLSIASFAERELKRGREDVEQRKHWNFIHKSPERTNICFVNAIDGWFSLPKLAQRETTHSSEFWIEIRIRIKAKFPSGTLFHLSRISSILCLRHCCEKARKHAFSLYTSSICKRVIACSREDETKISSNWRVLSTIPEGYENKFRNFQKTSFEMVEQRVEAEEQIISERQENKSAVENYVDGESWSFSFSLYTTCHISPTIFNSWRIFSSNKNTWNYPVLSQNSNIIFWNFVRKWPWP